MSAPQPDREQEIRARAEAATPGPWRSAEATDSFVSQVLAADGRTLGRVAADDNATFMAHAREDVPWLLAENARLRARAAELDSMLRVVNEKASTAFRERDAARSRVAELGADAARRIAAEERGATTVAYPARGQGCTWPTCLPEAEQQQLVADIGSEMHGGSAPAREQGSTE
jgi:hypothetical protein